MGTYCRSAAVTLVIAILSCSRGKADKAQRAEDSEKHLVLPGWEDLVVGRTPPKDAMQACSDETMPDGLRTTTCKGCRSAMLPTPCIEVMIISSDNDKADMITASLPESDEAANKAIKSLKDAWGPSASTRHDQTFDYEEWHTPLEAANLTTDHYDLSKLDFQNPKSRVPLAQHPKRLITITAAAEPTPPNAPTMEPQTAVPQPEPVAVEFGTKRCAGTSVIQLLIALKSGLRDPPASRTCIYEVVLMYVTGTTRDGWTTASMASMNAAFRVDRPYVNGAMIRSRRAVFLGIARFTMVDGSGQNVATFELSDAPAPKRGEPSYGAKPPVAANQPATPSDPATPAGARDAFIDQMGLSKSAPQAAKIAVSSTQAPGPGYTFGATNLIDGDLATSWQPRSSDKSPWFRLDFPSEITISSIAIANGFQTKDKFGDEFTLNSRISNARLRFSDNTETRVRFEPDARGLVRFDVPSKATKSVTVLVDATYEGTRWHDLAVSEVAIDAK